MRNSLVQDIFWLLILSGYIGRNGGKCSPLSNRVVIEKCGERKQADKITFVSPSYPNFLKNELLCTLSMILHKDTVGIRLDFVDVVMTGKASEEAVEKCDSDIFLIRGFKTWSPPPMCGNLTGYSTVIERTLNTVRMKTFTVIWIVSSEKYRWKVKLTQMKPRQHYLEPISVPQFKPEINVPKFFRKARIINGHDTAMSEVPWQAKILVKADEYLSSMQNATTGNATETKQCPIGGVHCGGTIISDRHILTAAHCLFITFNKLDGVLRIDSLKVVLGSNSCTETPLKNRSNDEQEYEIERAFFHYGFTKIPEANDIAVLKLKGRISFNENVKIVPMAKWGEMFNGKEAVASGWGMTTSNDTDSHPYVLQSSWRFFVRNASECKSAWESSMKIPERPDWNKHFKHAHILNSTLCTRTKFNVSSPDEKIVETERIKEMVNVGHGDSGGPLVSNSFSGTGEMVLIGVISYAVTLGEEKGLQYNVDFFQSVAYFRNWIDLAMMD